MKRILQLTFLLSVMLVMLVLTGCSGISIEENGLVLGENYRLESGDTLRTDLTIIGGNATLDENSTVDGDLTVIGGNVSIDGTIEGDVSVMGGHVFLDDNALVNGDLVTMGGTVQRSAQARVRGNERSENPSTILPWMRSLPVVVNFDPITGPLMAIFQAFALAALAIVMQLFAAPYMNRTGQTVLAQPIVSGGVGLLTIIVAPALLIILLVTIILIPLSLVGILGLGLAILFGWLVLGMLLGRQLSIWLKQPWSDPVSAGLGTLTLSLVSSMLNLIPCLGWLANALIWLIALGAVLLTRFGTQSYPTLATPRPPSPVNSVPSVTDANPVNAVVDEAKEIPAAQDGDNI